MNFLPRDQFLGAFTYAMTTMPFNNVRADFCSLIGNTKSYKMYFFQSHYTSLQSATAPALSPNLSLQAALKIKFVIQQCCDSYVSCVLNDF